jgi:hypothetical protein
MSAGRPTWQAHPTSPYSPRAAPRGTPGAACVHADKREYAARTIRPKITNKLPEFLTEFPALHKQQVKWAGKAGRQSGQAKRAGKVGRQGLGGPGE